MPHLPAKSTRLIAASFVLFNFRSFCVKLIATIVWARLKLNSIILMHAIVTNIIYKQYQLIQILSIDLSCVVLEIKFISTQCKLYAAAGNFSRHILVLLENIAILSWYCTFSYTEVYAVIYTKKNFFSQNRIVYFQSILGLLEVITIATLEESRPNGPFWSFLPSGKPEVQLLSTFERETLKIRKISTKKSFHNMEINAFAFQIEVLVPNNNVHSGPLKSPECTCLLGSNPRAHLFCLVRCHSF